MLRWALQSNRALNERLTVAESVELLNINEAISQSVSYLSECSTIDNCNMPLQRFNKNNNRQRASGYLLTCSHALSLSFAHTHFFVDSPAIPFSSLFRAHL